MAVVRGGLSRDGSPQVEVGDGDPLVTRGDETGQRAVVARIYFRFILLVGSFFLRLYEDGSRGCIHEESMIKERESGRNVRVN